MTAPLPTQTITGSTAADIRSTTPGVAALVETFQAGDTITLNNDGDYALGGEGPDVIVIGGTASVSLANSVVAGSGADTITIGTAAGSLAVVGFSVEANQGNDSISITAGGTFNSAFVGGGLGADTIAIQAITQYINSNIKGGDIGDSITITSGALTNTIVEGNKGGDTIKVATTAATNGSVGGGEGQDTISFTTAGNGAVSWINGGAGLDSINVNSGVTFSTLAGGGLADTISFNDTFGGGTIYGDAVGVTTSGSGTGGTEDGADLITSTAAITAGATIYGAGANDTISFADVTSTAAGVFANGGDGADSILFADNQFVGTAGGALTLAGGNGADTIAITTADAAAFIQAGAGLDSIKVAAGTALTIAGGAGLDTIVFTNAAAGGTNVDGGSQADAIYVGTAASALTAFNGSGTVAGGDGADTIAALGFASAGSINGGAGNDSISFGTAASQAWTAIGTINGGAGTDTVSFAASAGAGATQSAVVTGVGVGSVAYEAGDLISLLSTAAGGAALTNGLVYAMTAATASVAAGGFTAAGSLGVYSDGTDTWFAFSTGTESAVAFRVVGADLVLTSATGLIAATTANFGFTLSGSASTGLSITLA